MPYLKSNFDQATLHYRIHNPPPHLASANKPTLLFCHPWPMSSRVFDHFILPLALTHGYRCISPDRRGFGKSDWAGPASTAANPVTYDVLAADLAQIVHATCTGPFIGLGASMGCAELIHLLSRHSDLAPQCKGLLFMGGNLPFMLQSESNPEGTPGDVWAGILDGLRGDRETFVAGALGGMFGEHVGVCISAGQKGRVERMIAEADPVATEAVAWFMGEMDFTDELRALGAEGKLRLLMLHGDSDMSLGVEAGPKKVLGLVKGAELKAYERAAHGLWLTHKDQCLQDILKFLEK